MKFHVLSINYISDTVYMIANADTLVQDLDLDELTAESLITVLEAEDIDAQSLGAEYSEDGCSPYVTSVEGIRLIVCPGGENHWTDAANGWDEACKVIAEYEEGDVCFPPPSLPPSTGDSPLQARCPNARITLPCHLLTMKPSIPNS